MDDMNKLFEQRGFKVKRSYYEGSYHFSITKNNYCVVLDYTYPSGESYDIANQHQQKFVEWAINKFEDDFMKKNTNPVGKELSISKVVFNPPATIIIWDDGTKTIVKCGKNDVYDQEKGIAMAICKKVFGNNGNYHSIFKKWLTKTELHDCCNCKYQYKHMYKDPYYGYGVRFMSSDPKKTLKSNWESILRLRENK